MSDGDRVVRGTRRKMAAIRRATIVLGAVVALSFAGPLTKLTHIDPLAVLAWRCAIGAGVLAVVALRRSSVDRSIKRSELPSLVVAALGFVGFVGLWSTSFAYIPIGPSTVIVSTAAVFTSIADWVIRGTPFRWRRVAGIAAALLAIIPGVWGSALSTTSDVRLGVALSLGGALCGAVFVLAVAGGRADRDTVTTWMLISSIGAVVAGTAAAVRGTVLVGLRPGVILILVVLALLPHCAGQGLVVLLAKEGDPVLGVIAAVGETVGASALALLWFKEPVSIGLVLSIACFGVGLGLLSGEGSPRGHEKGLPGG